MKKLALYAVVAFSTFSLSEVALSSDRADHFQGKSAATLEEAVDNFSTHNKKLADILAKDELAATDMVEIHELTYTLENALEKIHEELEELAETLEEVHLASEKLDATVVKEKGDHYVETAAKFIP